MPAHAASRAQSGRAIVGLVSANPLALPELQRMAQRSRLRTRSMHLNLDSRPDIHEVRVPKASLYVLDAWSTGRMTEAVVASIRATRPGARLIVLTHKLSEVASFSLLQLGVKGLVNSKVATKELGPAILAVAGGGVWVPRALIASFLDRVMPDKPASEPPPQARRLSARERQVLDCVMQSLSTKEISSSLNISESTVKFHLAQLFQKFGVRRRADLILKSIQQPASLVH
jgi:DNA-binding NarL/FixJ family response regulator